MYNIEPLDCVENFKYLGLDVPSNHRCNECSNLRQSLRIQVLSSQEIHFRHFGDTGASLWSGSVKNQTQLNLMGKHTLNM